MATKKKTTPAKSKAAKPSRKTAKPVAKPVRKAAPKAAAPKATPKKGVAKPAPKKATAAKAAPRKPTPKKMARKSPPKPAPAKKSSAKKAPAKSTKSAAAPAPAKVSPKASRVFRKEELAAFRAMLQQNLELVQGNLNALAGDNLKLSPMDSTGDISTHSTHMADHGTDNFDRELALSLASSRQDSLYDIEDAIRRIDDGEYGACEACGKPIERPRLKALPFAKKCLTCQNAAERGRGRYQPFRSTSHPYNPVGSDDLPES